MNEFSPEKVFSQAQALVNGLKPDVNGGKVGRYSIDPILLNPIWKEGFVPITAAREYIEKPGNLVIYHKQADQASTLPRTGCLFGLFRVFGLVDTESRSSQVAQETTIILYVELGTEPNNDLRYDVTLVETKDGQRNFLIHTVEPNFMRMATGPRLIDSRGFSRGIPTEKELKAMGKLLEVIELNNPDLVRKGEQAPQNLGV